MLAIQRKNYQWRMPCVANGGTSKSAVVVFAVENWGEQLLNGAWDEHETEWQDY